MDESLNGTGGDVSQKTIESYAAKGRRYSSSSSIRAARRKQNTTRGSSRFPAAPQAVLESGTADFVVLGRQFTADPEWANKARTSRAQDIRPCLSCNYCAVRDTSSIIKAEMRHQSNNSRPQFSDEECIMVRLRGISQRRFELSTPI